MTEIRIVDVPEQHTAVVREKVPMAELTSFFGRAFEAALHAVRAQRAVPVGPPFGAYHGPPGETVDVEAGFPVASPIEDAQGVVASTLPGGRVVEAVHVGPYDTMVGTYAEIEAWMAALGARARAADVGELPHRPGRRARPGDVAHAHRLAHRLRIEHPATRPPGIPPRCECDASALDTCCYGRAASTPMQRRIRCT
ncbi:GyrI-like domain-containing protein [Humibacillus xanthopallidus]|uniref:GyrI-like domain-containing protein n=1 Tax=Humibacillus xanthopallidus TaxID=412689 RepID=UPI00384BA9DC